jgi:hypothetical protein
MPELDQLRRRQVFGMRFVNGMLLLTDPERDFFMRMLINAAKVTD